MNILNSVVYGIYKCNTSGTVDYHAGGFFVRKHVAYLIFLNADNALLYEREEGLHPKDNKYENLVKYILAEKKAEPYKVSQPKANVNLLKLTSNQIEILCMPSIFMENIENGSLTEIVVDNRKTGAILFFNLVFQIND